MPTAVAAGIAKTALAAPVVGGGIGSALGAGLTAGASLASGAGIFSNFMAGAAPGLVNTVGSVAPTVAANLAPAATSQLMGTIGGSVAPGAFGANLAGAGQGLASALPGAYNPAIAQNLGAKFLAQSQAAGMPVANANNLNFLRSATAGLPGSGSPLQMYSGMNGSPFMADTLQGSALPGVTSNLPAASLGNAVTGPALPNVTSQLATGPATTQIVPPTSAIQPGQNWFQNIGNLISNPSMQGAKDYAAEHPYATSAAVGLGAMGLTNAMKQKKVPTPEDKAMIRPYTYERTQRPEAYATSPTMDSSERNYFSEQYTPLEPYKASEKAEGGIASAYAVGGPVEQMAAMNSVGANTGYPMANLQTPVYSNPTMQRPEATNVIAPSGDAGVGAYTGEPRFAEGGEAKTEGGYKYSYDPNTMQFTQLQTPTIVPGRGGVVGGIMGNLGTKVSGGTVMPAVNPMSVQQVAPISIPSYQTPEQQLGLTGFYDRMSQPQLGLSDLSGFYNAMNQKLAGYGGYAKGGNVGGESHLGDYSDGGRLLKGPGDGVSDSIPASIGGRQPARLADGEFVIPARIVSELGNGSTEAGARKLYAMMERVQATRKKSIGKKKVAVNSKADKHLPA
jgi:hypothetical protein